jgi:uncharacterized protein (UPF0218 family)
VSVEDVKKFGALPDCIGTQEEVFLILPPVDVAHGKVIILGHLQRALALLEVLRRVRSATLALVGELIDKLVI